MSLPLYRDQPGTLTFEDVMLAGSGTWRRELTPSEVVGLLALIDDVSVRWVSPSTVGLDGTTYSLSLISLQREFRVQWWQNVPAEWKGIAPLVDELAALVENPSEEAGWEALTREP